MQYVAEIAIQKNNKQQDGIRRNENAYFSRLSD